MSLISLTLAANSLTGSNPLLEERLPPEKFILICLLHFSEKVFKIGIEDFLSLVMDLT